MGQLHGVFLDVSRRFKLLSHAQRAVVHVVFGFRFTAIAVAHVFL
jgi:hypothetical protein